MSIVTTKNGAHINENVKNDMKKLVFLNVFLLIVWLILYHLLHTINS